MAIKVFVSYRNTDLSLAQQVARRVRVNGLDTYLDAVDDALVKDGPDLADHLLGRISECQQLIAVVSNHTKDSWWVPWEIGVGSERGFRMASYSEQYVSLPSYLEKWPALHTERHIDLYCHYSKATDAAVDRHVRDAATELGRMQIRKSQATDFHKTLKSVLR